MIYLTLDWISFIFCIQSIALFVFSCSVTNLKVERLLQNTHCLRRIKTSAYQKSAEARAITGQINRCFMIDSLLKVRYNNRRKILVDFSGFSHLFATQLSCDSCVAFLLLYLENTDRMIQQSEQLLYNRDSSKSKFVVGVNLLTWKT